MNKLTIGFPGLGIEGFTINKTAFTVFGMEIRWYAIIICTGIISAFFYFMYRGKKTEQIVEDEILNATLFTVPIAIVGARFLYVITNLDRYNSFYDAINIREGGLAIYGAIIFGGVTMLVYSLIRKLNPLQMLDAIAPAVMIGQIIGRWGNFMNGEAYGSSAGVESLPWRMTITDYTGRTVVAHPTFLYESLWNILGFVIINHIYNKKKFNGQIFLLYAGWYGIGRAFIELLRTDSLSIVGGEVEFWYQKLMFWLGITVFIVAAVAYVILRNRPQKDEIADFLGAKGVLSAEDDTDENIKPEEEIENDNN